MHRIHTKNTKTLKLINYFLKLINNICLNVYLHSYLYMHFEDMVIPIVKKHHMMLVSYLAHILRDSSHSNRVEHRQENLLTWLLQLLFHENPYNDSLLPLA